MDFFIDVASNPIKGESFRNIVTLAEEDKLDNRINKEYTCMHTGRSDLLEFDLSR